VVSTSAAMHVSNPVTGQPESFEWLTGTFSAVASQVDLVGDDLEVCFGPDDGSFERQVARALSSKVADINNFRLMRGTCNALRIVLPALFVDLLTASSGVPVVLLAAMAEVSLHFKDKVGRSGPTLDPIGWGLQ